MTQDESKNIGISDEFPNQGSIDQLKDINIIDGFLVGGASQNSKKFIDIIKKTFN